MKKIFSLLLLCAAVVLASCQKDDPTTDPVAVAFSTLTANGSDTETTSALTLTFDKVIEGLAADDITLTAGETGATKGALTAKGEGVYELALSGIKKADLVSISVAKTGYKVSPDLKTVAVKFYTAPSDVAVAFSTLTANGSDTETTSALTLTFDKVIEGLAADDITLTAGETGATKGALTAKGEGVYELAISGIAKAGDVTVAVAKDGYTITPASQKVAVSYVAHIITNKALIAAIEAVAKVTFTKNADGDVDVTDNKAAIEGITLLNLIDKGLASLEGIEYFTALTTLFCVNNQLTALDVSKNTALTELYCYGNQLTALDVSKNTALTELSCYNNQLTALDVSKNAALTELGCYYNQLTALDVSKNTALTILDCYNNQLTALDVSKNTALTELYCYGNQLTALDVSKNTALTSLDCYNNQLTALDISKNTALQISTSVHIGAQKVDGKDAEIKVTVTQAQKDEMNWFWSEQESNKGVVPNVK